MEKIWLKHYSPGVPAEINPDAYQSLVEVFDISCKQYADRSAFYNLGVTLTYAELDQYARDFAAYLQQKLNLKKGSRLAIMLPNILQYPIALFGAFRAGLIVVNINPLYTADELAYQLNNSESETILALENFAFTVQSTLNIVPTLKNIIIAEIGDFFSPFKKWLTKFALKYIHRKIPNWNIPHALSFKNVLDEGKECAYNPVPMSNEDIVFLQYTGGTTGISKGAILTHRNLIANIQQADAWFKAVLRNKQEIVVTALPLYHIFSLTANCLYFTKIGGLNILITNPRDISGMVREIKKFNFSAITGVNTLFNSLLKNPQFSKLNFNSLHLALGGGAAVQKIVAENWHKITGIPILEAYGLTETSPCVTINPVYMRAYNGTVGLPVSSTDVSLLDDNHNEVPIGQPGELAVKGPQVMKGYWENPKETEKVITKSGWLLTGDIATIDEQGFVRIIERKKDMILVSGFNVYPNEIEDVLAQIPGVREVAIIGVEDENSGEAVKAFIIKDDPNLTAADVIKYAREHLTPYKVPKRIEFCKELPKTPVGKILRRSLRDAHGQV